MSLIEPTGIKTDNSSPDISEKTKSAITEFEKRQPMEGRLLAKIYTPFHTFYEGDAFSVSATNESGIFDILPGHHNFITMLSECDVAIVTADNERQVVPIMRGLMHVKGDKVIIFLDV